MSQKNWFVSSATTGTLTDGGPYHTETSPVQTSFYMIGTSVIKELNKTKLLCG